MGRPAFVWSPLTIPPTPSMSLMMWTRTRQEPNWNHPFEGSSLECAGYLDRAMDEPAPSIYKEKTGRGSNLRRPVSKRTDTGPAGLHLEVVAFERADPFPQLVGNRTRLPLFEIDVDDRLVGRRHEQIVVDPVDLCLEGHARPADSCGPNENLEEVVEPRRSVVLDVQGTQYEVALEIRVQQMKVAEILDTRDVEVGEVAAVVDDP